MYSIDIVKIVQHFQMGSFFFVFLWHPQFLYAPLWMHFFFIIVCYSAVQKAKVPLRKTNLHKLVQFLERRAAPLQLISSSAYRVMEPNIWRTFSLYFLGAFKHFEVSYRVCFIFYLDCQYTLKYGTLLKYPFKCLVINRVFS